MLFSNKRGNPRLSIIIDNFILEEKDVVTFLGVDIDNKLTWKSHIQHICNKISKSIAILRTLKYSFPKHILIMIYMSLIYSYISWCNVVCSSAYEYHLKPLIVLTLYGTAILLSNIQTIGPVGHTLDLTNFCG